MAEEVGPTPVADLPMEVYRWLQSLDLSLRVRNIRRDFSNGYLLANVFSHYYPRDIATHNFINGSSIPAKMSNWHHLQQVISKRKLLLPKHLVDGTLHCKPGAAEALVLFSYGLLTGRIVKQPSRTDWDFTDRAYQRQLPLHARATASRTLKNNIRNSELLAEPGQQNMQRKVQALLLDHEQQRREERSLFPGRFDIKPTMRELAIRLR
uniref:spermatogenesis-associated protein 4-like n=2 Tax=Myxine glutinosa TaxID=7769 RepID=UPI00358FA1E8